MSRIEQYPGVPYYLLGSLFLSLALGHLLYTNEALVVTGARGLLPLLLAGGLIAAGSLFRSLEPSRHLVLQAGLILGGGAIFTSTVAGYIVWIESASGLTVAALSYPVIVAGATGALLATPITYYYITATQRLTELEAKYAEAERMRKQLSVLDRVLRHNLRNELNIILGWVNDPTERGDITPDDSAHRIVNTHLTRLETLCETARQVRQVFDTNDRVSHDIARVVEAVVDSVGAQAPAVSLRTDLPETAPVRAHPHIETAIRELIENAIEHNDTDALTVTVAVTPAVKRADGTQMCRIEVRDTGQGISHLEIEALAQPEETPLSHGRGLGLWLVSAVIEQSAGHLEFAEADQGTTVRLWLPRAQSPTAASAATADTAPVAAESE